MKDIHFDHPETLFGPNPLLEVMAPFASLKQLPGLMLREPLHGISWQSLPAERREPLLEAIEQHYFPTRECLDIAASFQNALRGGLHCRNPLAPFEQRRINQLGLAVDVPQVALQSLPVRAGGAIGSAITGMGKSTLAKRVLEVIAPDQVVRHGISKACGWSTLTQVLYLHIDAPFNGTRVGLLAKILGGLDTLLGTNYMAQFNRYRNLDGQMVYVVKVLSMHRLGMLVIDENQQDNFEECAWQREFVLFFLALMNFGIPVVLLGNPLAFGGLKSVSQVMRRFSSIGFYEFRPAVSAAEEWWDKDFVPGIAAFRVCEETPSIEVIKAYAFDAAGGIRGIWPALWVEAQRFALRRGGMVAKITMEDLKAAKDTPRTRELISIAAYALGAVKQAGRVVYTDLPTAAANDDANGQEGSPGSGLPSSHAPPSMAEVRKLVRKINSDKDKKEALKKKNAELLASISPSDLRRSNDSAEILAGLREEQAELMKK